MLFSQRKKGEVKRLKAFSSQVFIFNLQPFSPKLPFILAPGKVLVNSEYIDVERLPSILKSWDVLVAPQADPVSGITGAIHYGHARIHD